MNKGSFLSISALKIYMKRGDNRKSGTWWGRFIEKPLSTYIVRAALQSGITHAAVNLGHIGFAANAKAVSYDNAEIPMNTMPVCVELLAPKRILEQFIREQAKHLADTTLVMVDGVHISSLHLAELEESVEHKPHSVEYITGGDVPLKVEHVEVDEIEEADASEAVG
jgi:PII-like signaling protein